MNHMRRIILLSIGLLVLQSSNAIARDAAPASTLTQLAQFDGPSLSEAVEQVRRQYRGRIISAETQTRGNREVHVIKVLTDGGEVKTVRIPGRSRGGRG